MVARGYHIALFLPNTGRESQIGELEQCSILGMVLSLTDDGPHVCLFGASADDNLL